MSDNIATGEKNRKAYDILVKEGNLTAEQLQAAAKTLGVKEEKSMTDNITPDELRKQIKPRSAPMSEETQTVNATKKGPSKTTCGLILVIYLVAGLIAVIGTVNYLGISPGGAPQQAVQYAALCWSVIGPYCFARMLEKILLSFHQ